MVRGLVFIQIPEARECIWIPIIGIFFPQDTDPPLRASRSFQVFPQANYDDADDDCSARAVSSFCSEAFEESEWTNVEEIVVTSENDSLPGCVGGWLAGCAFSIQPDLVGTLLEEKSVLGAAVFGGGFAFREFIPNQSDFPSESSQES